MTVTKDVKQVKPKIVYIFNIKMTFHSQTSFFVVPIVLVNVIIDTFQAKANIVGFLGRIFSLTANNFLLSSLYKVDY